MDASEIRLEELERAIDQQAPDLMERLLQFLEQPDVAPPKDAPENAMSLWDLKSELRSLSWHTEKGEARMLARQALWKKYLSQDFALPERLHSHHLLQRLYDQDSAWSREVLLFILQQVPLVWGLWRGMKALFKHAEARHDLEVLGAMSARCDIELSSSNNPKGEISTETLTYLRRRGWRYLRELGQHMPSRYPDAVVHFLRWYPNWDMDSYYDQDKWYKVWIPNHVFFHEHDAEKGNRKYSAGSFNYSRYYNQMPDDLAKHRAFPKTWEERPRPLLDLLLLCRADHVARFAMQVLKTAHAGVLRDLPLAQLIRLGQRPLGQVQQFVMELIKDNPSWQQSKFKELGLHELVLDHFLFSNNHDVREYAIAYAKSYAKDMSVPQLLNLLRTDESNLHGFALSVLSKRDPRKELGLDILREMMLLSPSFDLAQKMFKKGFTPEEVDLAWFESLLFSKQWDVVEFAVKFLKKEMPKARLTLAWLQSLLSDTRMEGDYYGAKDFALDQIKQRAKQLDQDWVQLALLHEGWSWTIQDWLRNGIIKSKQLDLSWLRAALEAQAWLSHPWVKAKKNETLPKGTSLALSYNLSDFARGYLANTKHIAPQDLGVAWLLSLLEESNNETNQDFATDYLLEHFAPADFATAEDLAEAADTSDTKTEESPAPAENPMAGKSVLFTGKLKQLTRSQAQKKVAELDGLIAKSVTKKLDYLVIGDDGSPLFTGGKKGSKMVKAEKLQAEGSPVQIISETAWLAMLTEGSAAKAEQDPAALAAGFTRLYRAATAQEAPPPLQQFAIEYLRRHHPVLGPLKTGLPLEGEQIIPRSLYRAELFLPLLQGPHAKLQELSIQIARYELRRWQVPAQDIFVLCDSPSRAARRFALSSLLGPKNSKDKAEHYFKPKELEPSLVFALCESQHKDTRHTGLTLLQRHYELLQGDSSVLRLAESPYRDIRTASVKLLWQRYRQPQMADDVWTPKKDKRATVRPADAAGREGLIAEPLLLDFLRIQLFGLPPGRLQKRPEGAPKPLSNSRAKLHMLDLYRELALEHAPFAEKLLPVLDEFLDSCHKQEEMACLVAKTQIEHFVQ